MYPNQQNNHTDSNLNNSNNTNHSTITPYVSNTNANLHVDPSHEITKNAISEKDTVIVANASEKLLFIVPYRCKLNRDSLKMEMRKVFFEKDTLPKSLNLIFNENINDSTPIKEVVFTKSLFSQHLLQPSILRPKPKVAEQQNWIVLIVLFVLLLIAILRVFYQKKFTLFVNAFISKRFSNQILRDENAITQSTSVVLSIVYLISISLFFYLVSDHFHQNLFGFDGFQKFSVILIGCICFYLIKFIANKLGGYILKVYKEIDEYIFNQFVVIQILGLCLTICCILLNFSVFINKEVVIYAGFATLIMGFVVRMVKSVGMVNMNSYSPVYIFLYLCTLEILPLIIIVKLIIR